MDGVSNSDGHSDVDSSRDFAQQFRVGIEGRLVFVDLSLRAAPTAFADGLEWELLGSATSKPDANDVITSGPIQTDAFSGVAEWIRVGPLDVPVAVGDVFAIALYAVEENSDNYSWLIGAEDDLHGEQFCQGLCGDDRGWSSSSDLGIRTCVQPVPEPSATLLQLCGLRVHRCARATGDFDPAIGAHALSRGLTLVITASGRRFPLISSPWRAGEWGQARRRLSPWPRAPRRLWEASPSSSAPTRSRSRATRALWRCRAPHWPGLRCGRS